MELDPYSFAPKYDERGREFLQCGRPASDWSEHPRSFSADDLAELEEMYRRNHYLKSSEEYNESGVIVEVEGEYRLCPWLEWTADSLVEEEIERYFKEIFPVYEPFRYESLYIHGSLDQPDHPILKSDFLMGRKTTKQAEEEVTEIESFYTELLTQYTRAGKIPLGCIPALTALREAFEAQVRRYAAYAAETHTRIQNVLKVVAAETEIGLLTRARELHKDLDQGSLWNYERRHTRFHTRRVWRGVQCGYPLKHMFGIFPLGNLLRNARPPLLGVAARQGMVFYLSQRDIILKAAFPLDRKRNVLEWLLYVALSSKEVPAWEAFSKSLDRDRQSENKRYTRNTEAFWDYVYELLGEDWKHRDIYEHVTVQAKERGLPYYKNFKSYEQRYQQHSRQEAGKS